MGNATASAGIWGGCRGRRLRLCRCTGGQSWEADRPHRPLSARQLGWFGL